MRVSLFLLFFLLPGVALAEYRTIEEVAQAYDVQNCRVCHPKIHGEWQSSAHAHSVANSIGILRDFLDWRTKRGKEIDREQLMRCMACHAPYLKDGSESLIREVTQLVVTATDEKDTPKKEEAKRSLDRPNINCISCHNTVSVLEKDLRGEPKKGVFYGPTGRPSPAHGTERSSAFRSYLFCGQCHRVYTPPDGEIIFCSSLYESYQDGYRKWGGAETCQDCHIKKGGRGHRMPGSHDMDLLKEGIELHVEAAGVRLIPGRWVPTAFVDVHLFNRAGHRTPDG